MKKIVSICSIFLMSLGLTIGGLLCTRKESFLSVKADNFNPVLYEAGSVPSIIDDFSSDYCYKITHSGSPLNNSFDIPLKYFEINGCILTNSLDTLMLSYGSDNTAFVIGYRIGDIGRVFPLTLDGDSSFYVVFDDIEHVAPKYRNYLKTMISAGKTIYKNSADLVSYYLGQIEDLEDSVSYFEGVVSSNTATINSLSIQVTSLQAQISTLEEELELSEEANEIYWSLIETLTSQLNASTLQIEELTSTNALLNGYITWANGEILNLQNNINTLQEQLDSAGAIWNVFDIIKLGFGTSLPLLDFEIAPNLSIGVILTIPFTMAILGFILKMLG